MEDNSSLEKLKKRLYKESKGDDARMKRDTFKQSGDRLKEYWDEPSKEQRANFRQVIETMKKPKRKGIVRPLVVFFGFLVLAGFIFYFWGDYIFQSNIVSSKNIDINIEGPSIINAGQNNTWRLFIINKNKVALELADLIIEYPSGSLSSSGNILNKERRPLGKILPGESSFENLTFFLTGNKDEQKDIMITLEYRMEESNAIFAKSASYPIKLANPPLGISFILPKEVQSGHEIKIQIDYVSNSDVLLKNLQLELEAPPGFQFLESDLKPSKGNNTWLIGDLSPNEKRTLIVKGILEGQDLVELNFRALIGLEEDGKLNILASESVPVLLKKPSVGLRFLINGQDIESVYGQKNITVIIPWQSNLPIEARNAILEVKLKSDIVNFQSLSVQNGFYRAYDNTIVWNASSLPSFSLIIPGGSGSAVFSFKLKNVFPVEDSGDKNFTIKMEAFMTVLEQLENSQVTTVESSAQKELKVSTDVQLAGRLLYSSGPFSNTGPIPPKAGEETTYTVVWSISNLYNDISNAVVRASLPPYISWLGVVSPLNENVFYNESTGEVLWNVGTIKAGTGILEPAKEMAFKIGFFPAVNQVGTSPVLVNQPIFEARDDFTNFIVGDSTESLFTKSLDGVQSNSSWGIVQP